MDSLKFPGLEGRKIKMCHQWALRNLPNDKKPCKTALSCFDITIKKDYSIWELEIALKQCWLCIYSSVTAAFSRSQWSLCAERKPVTFLYVLVITIHCFLFSLGILFLGWILNHDLFIFHLYQKTMYEKRVRGRRHM